MMLGYKFWTTYRVVVLRRGFDSKFDPALSRCLLKFNVYFGGGKNVLWCG
jgi:hypothetical protein